MNSRTRKNADTVIVLDFETTGLSPDQGDRAIEIGAVRIENGQDYRPLPAADESAAAGKFLYRKLYRDHQCHVA